MHTLTSTGRDLDGLTRTQRNELMLDLLMICREEIGLVRAERPLTLRQIAAFLGLSLQAVQQTERRAMSKLKLEAIRRKRSGHPLFASLRE